MVISTKPILVTGPAGNTGGIIVDTFQKRGVPFIMMSHNKKRVNQLNEQFEEEPGIEARLGNYDKPSSLDKALEGVGTAYLVCTPDERLVSREINFIYAAKRAGVEHLVYHSAHLSKISSKSPNLHNHGIVEQVLKGSGLPYTITRPGGYMQTWALIADALLTGREEFGVYSMPGADGKIPLVDVRDVAAATVKILLEPDKHVGKTYIITGLEAMGYADHARIWSEALGKPVEYQSPPELQFRLIMAGLGFAGAPLEHAIHIFSLQRAGKAAEIYPGLTELGIEYTPYDKFVQDWIAGETSGGNSFQDQLDTWRVRLGNELFLTGVAARRNIQSALKYLGIGDGPK